MSLVVSLTTTPMLSAKFLRGAREAEAWVVYRMGERVLAWLTREYERGAALGAAPSVASAGDYGADDGAECLSVSILVPKGFFPQQDTGRIGGQVRGQQDVSFDAMKDKVTQMADIVRKDPGVADVDGVPGGGPDGGRNKRGQYVHCAEAGCRAAEEGTACAR